MKDEDIIREYYELKISNMPGIDPPKLSKQKVLFPLRHKKIGWEDIIGALITLGYLTQLLAPVGWFSFGRALFMFRFGF
jgi:hypothetical protein